MQIEKFNPTKAEIQATVSEVEKLTISGIEDTTGYEAVKAGKKKLADMRIKITKFGKEQRDEAIKWQREVLRQEKELLEMIEPTESKLKGKLEAVDEEKKKQERLVLLPSRKKMLEEIEVFILDDEILAMDEKEFSQFFTDKKLLFVEKKEQELKNKEEEIKRAEELEKAKKESAEKAIKETEEKAKREKQEAIEKIKREQEEKERKAKEEEERKKREEEEKARLEKEEQIKAEKNRKYKAWIKSHGYTEELRQSGEMHVMRDGNTFTLYKKIDQITIK